MYWYCEIELAERLYFCERSDTCSSPLPNTDGKDQENKGDSTHYDTGNYTDLKMRLVGGRPGAARHGTYIEDGAAPHILPPAYDDQP